MQGKPFLKPSPLGWGWAPTCTSLLPPCRGQARVGQESSLRWGSAGARPLCAQQGSGVVALCPLGFMSAHGQPALLLFVAPLSFSALPCPAGVSPAASIKCPGVVWLCHLPQELKRPKAPRISTLN